MTNLVEHDREIVWPEQSIRAQVFNTGTPAVAYAEVPATVALLAWVHKDALINRLEAEIDGESDDKNALGHEERQKREAEVMGDLLAIERDESALVWQAQAQGLPAERRADCGAQAILGCRLRGGRGSAPA